MRVNSEFRPPEYPRSIPRNLRAEGGLSSKGLGQGPRSFGVPSFAGPSLKPCFLRQPRFLSSCRGDDSSDDSPACAAFFDSPPRARLDIGRKQGSLDRGPRHREDGRSHSYGRANSGWVWGQGQVLVDWEPSPGPQVRPLQQLPASTPIALAGIGVKSMLS